MYIMGGVLGQSVGLDYNFGQGIGFSAYVLSASSKGNCRYQLPGLAEWNQQMLEKIRKTSSTNSAIVQIFFLSLQKKVSTKIINYE